MSEILRRSEIDDLLDRIINTADDWQDDVDRLHAHDAALRAEVARLRAALVVIAGRCQCGTHAGGCVHDIARAALAKGDDRG